MQDFVPTTSVVTLERPFSDDDLIYVWSDGDAMVLELSIGCEFIRSEKDKLYNALPK